MILGGDLGGTKTLLALAAAGAASVVALGLLKWLNVGTAASAAAMPTPAMISRLRLPDAGLAVAGVAGPPAGLPLPGVAGLAGAAVGFPLLPAAATPGLEGLLSGLVVSFMSSSRPKAAKGGKAVRMQGSS